MLKVSGHYLNLLKNSRRKVSRLDGLAEFVHFKRAANLKLQELSTKSYPRSLFQHKLRQQRKKLN